MKKLGMLKIVVFILMAGSQSYAMGERVFTRQVDQLTGKPGNGVNIEGQDSPLIINYKDMVLFFFGDTTFTTHQFYDPNSMATTKDFNATDGINLNYYQTEGHKHLAPLPRLPDDASDWLSAPFVVGDDIYAFYYKVAPTYGDKDPTTPDSLGSGLAVMKGGVPPFVPTGFEVSVLDPLARVVHHSLVNGDYIYFFGSVSGYLTSSAVMGRVLSTKITDRNSYEFFTETGWSSSGENLKHLFENSNGPTVQWNSYFNKWIAVGTQIYDKDRFASAVSLHMADNLEGPWSDEIQLYHTPTPETSGAYNAAHLNTFDKNGGRTIYFASTRWDVYNTFLYETNFGYADSQFKVLEAKDDTGGSIRAFSRGLAGFRFTGNSFFETKKVGTSKLTLKLRQKIPKDRDITLRIQMGVPNDDNFKPGTKSVYQRTKISEVEFPVHLVRGQTEIVLENALNPIIDAALNDSRWKDGFPNSINLYISRTDKLGDFTLSFDSVENKSYQTLDTCFGNCTK